MADGGMIKVIAEYLVENESEMQKFREEIQALDGDVSAVNESTAASVAVNKEQESTFKTLGKAVNKVQEGFAYLEAGLDATTGKTVRYADEVRSLTLISGQSAEDASRMLQVFGDFGVSLDEIGSVAKKMAENGIEPTIENVAELADEYNALEPGQARNKFLFDELGKSGLKYAEVLSKGRDALLKMSDGVDESLILSKKQLDDAKALQIAQEGVNDATDALAITLGTKLLPIQTDVTNGVNVLVRGWEIAQDQGISLAEATDIAGREIWEEQQAMLAANDAAIEFSDSEAEVAAALAEVSKANAAVINDAIALTDSQKDFQATQDESTAKIAELQAKLAELFPWEIEKRQEILDQIAEEEQKYEDSAAAFEDASRRRIAMMAIEQVAMQDGVEGFSEIEQAKAFKILETLGVTESAAARRVIAEQAVAKAMADGTLAAQDADRALQMMVDKGYTIEVAINAITRVTGALSGINPQAQAGGYGYQASRNNRPQGFASGGISIGPESGHWELLHGDEAVIPLQNGAVPVAMERGGSGVGAGGNITVVLNIQSPITVLDKQSALATLTPLVEEAVKELQGIGVFQ